jgi:hypothetical protein
MGVSTGWTDRVRFGSRIRAFIFTASRPALGSTQPRIKWVLGAHSSGVKRPDHETVHSHPSSAEAKNGGAVPPLLHTSSWLGALIKHGDNYILRNKIFVTLGTVQVQ